MLALDSVRMAMFSVVSKFVAIYGACLIAIISADKMLIPGFSLAALHTSICPPLIITAALPTSPFGRCELSVQFFMKVY